MKEYKVVINFCGFIGCDEEYIVDADSREEAEELALEEARDDLAVIEIREEGDDDEESF